MSTDLAGVLLGFAGSLHCVAMCGPLMLTLRRATTAGGARLAPGLVSLAAYHGARLAVYGAAGTAAGAAGDVAVLMGAGRALAWLGGAVLLATAASQFTIRPLLPRVSFGWLRAALGFASRFRTTRSPLCGAVLGGALNACLPCGMVYAALTVATSTGESSAGLRFMLLFGLGTLPALAGTWLAAGVLGPVVRNKLRFATPVALAVVGLMLMARGYAGGVQAPATHRVHASAHVH
jgi:sulfite exporter TauE/SafE